MNRKDKKDRNNKIPFWRDVRVLGILGQVLFIIAALLFFRTLGANFIDNIGKLGKAQFICRDGSYSVRCAFDFLETEAGFGIAESVIPYEVTDPYWQAVKVGLLNTIKVAILAIFLSTILGIIAGIARLSKNWLVSNVARWYIEIIRNTPLLVQIVFIYFTLFLTLPPISAPFQPFGLPIFLSRRSITFPGISLMPSAMLVFFALLMSVIQFQITVLWLKGKEKAGKKKKPVYQWAFFISLLILGVSLPLIRGQETTQGFLTPKTARIREYNDIAAFLMDRSGINHISDLEKLDAKTREEVAIRLCSLNQSKSETNMVNWLQSKGFPFIITGRSKYIWQAMEKYQKGDCDFLIAPLDILAAEKSSLEKPTSHLIISFPEKPIQWDIPRQEKGGVAGGNQITPEFAGLLLALTIYAGAFIAEIVRAGIQSVPRSQFEAATALGLTEWQKLRMVILPQSLRVIIPPLISEYLGTIKDSSLGIAIGYPDLYNVSYTILNQSGRSLQVILVVMCIYMTMSLITSGILNWYNNKMRFAER